MALPPICGLHEAGRRRPGKRGKKKRSKEYEKKESKLMKKIDTLNARGDEDLKFIKKDKRMYDFYMTALCSLH